METMTDAQVWEMVQAWMNDHRGAVSRAYTKYGWIHSAASEDTQQDIMLYCFKTIRSLEQDSLSKGIVPDWKSRGTMRILTNRTIGLYHANAWLNRSIENMRKSDFYNIKPGSDEDTKIKSHDIEDVEAWGLFAPVEYNYFNDEDRRATDSEENKELTKKTLELLISVLPPKKSILVTEVYLGGCNGELTHQEAGDKTNLTRSAVSKALKASKAKILKFCKKNSISINLSKQEFYEKVKQNTKPQPCPPHGLST